MWPARFDIAFGHACANGACDERPHVLVKRGGHAMTYHAIENQGRWSRTHNPRDVCTYMGRVNAPRAGRLQKDGSLLIRPVFAKMTLDMALGRGLKPCPECERKVWCEVPLA